MEQDELLCVGFVFVLNACSVHQLGSVLKHDTLLSYTQKRHMLKILNRVLNYPDQKRQQEYGADRACAEWILRCGGRLRWEGFDEWLTDYNFLPHEDLAAEFKLQDIDMSTSSVMAVGFVHLRDCQHVKSIKMHQCRYVDNACLRFGPTTQASLERLQVSACKGITDQGLLNLSDMWNLKDLHLKDLPYVKNKLGCYEKLQEALPKCDILYVDIEDILNKEDVDT